MKNERGGIISKILIIPIGLAFMLGFFVLGYYVGKYQSKPGAQNENMIPLPEIVSKNLPKKDEFTFFKTLTDRDDKTVSIDLKPKAAAEDKETVKKPIAVEPATAKGAQQPKKELKTDPSAVKDKPAQTKPTQAKPAPPKQTEKPKAPLKKETVVAQSPNSKLRYTLQVASYPERGLAEDDVKNMKQKGYAAFVVASDLPGKGTWYRVRVGSFANKNSAEKLQKELQAKAGLSPIITIE